jgi:hypothetical protein
MHEKNIIITREIYDYRIIISYCYFNYKLYLLLLARKKQKRKKHILAQQKTKEKIVSIDITVKKYLNVHLTLDCPSIIQKGQ